MKMLRLFEGKKKAPETSHEKYTKYGWERTNLGSSSHVHSYGHPDHPGHVIHHNTRLGSFEHHVHHSFDLDKHLAKHDSVAEEISAASRDWQHSER